MNYGIKGKNAVVLAGTQGLGRAVVIDLLQEGCNVATCSRSSSNVKKLLDDCKHISGVELVAETANLNCSAEIDSFFEIVNKKFEHIDILVTNAGGPKVGKFESLNDSDWNNAFQQNFMSIVQSIRYVLPSMKNRKYGRIIAVTSIAVKNPVENLMLSNAIRAGVTGLIKSLSNEVARDGITVNTACPGYTLTDRVFQLAEKIAQENEMDSEAIIKGWNDAIPMGRMASPEEFSSLVMYLCSERAAYVTGTSFWSDGGFYSGLM